MGNKPDAVKLGWLRMRTKDSWTKQRYTVTVRRAFEKLRRMVEEHEARSDRYPGVLVGSYPKFHVDGATVEVVVKSSDPTALEAAVAWIDQALEEATR